MTSAQSDPAVRVVLSGDKCIHPDVGMWFVAITGGAWSVGKAPRDDRGKKEKKRRGEGGRERETETERQREEEEEEEEKKR